MSIYTEYAAKALRTAKPYPSENAQVVKDMHLLHGVAGIASELVELREALDAVKSNKSLLKRLDGVVSLGGEESSLVLDDRNFYEEVGDLMWYLTLILHTQGGDVARYLQRAEDVHVHGCGYTDECFAQITHIAGQLADAVKRVVFYRDDYSVPLICVHARGVIEYASRLLVSVYQDVPQDKRRTLKDALRANLDKLMVRFPDGFKEEAAIERDLKAEYVALENAGIEKFGDVGATDSPLEEKSSLTGKVMSALKKVGTKLQAMPEDKFKSKLASHKDTEFATAYEETARFLEGQQADEDVSAFHRGGI